MRSAETARSDRIRMLLSASTASVASRQMRSTRLAPAPPRPRPPARCMSMRARCGRRRPASSSMARIFSRSALVRIGWRHFQPLVRAGVVAQQVGPRPDHRDQRHHQFLADRIDRRIGDLGEVLLEIVVEQLGLASRAPRSACRCPSSPPDRRRSTRHRLQEELDVFLGVAEGLLAIEQRRRIVRPRRRARSGSVGQFFQLELRGASAIPRRARRRRACA